MPKYGNALTVAVSEIIGEFYVADTNTVNLFQAASNTEAEQTHYDMINEILHRMIGMDISVRLDHKNLARKVNKKRFHNVVFVDSYEAFMKFFKNLSTDMFEFQGFYIIVLTTYRYDQYSVMSDMFEYLWSLYITHVNVIWKPSQNDNEAFMYTYFPFTNFYCGKSYPVQLNQYSFGRWMSTGKKIFPAKTANLHACPLTAAVVQTGPFMKVVKKENNTVKLDGIDGTVLNTVSELMNFTLKIITSSEQGGFLKNGTTTGDYKIQAEKKK